MRVSLKGTDLTLVQAQVDAWVGGFVRQAADWRSLAAMTAGGLAYRAGRIGAVGLGGGSALRTASVGLGLTAEVSTFELSHRALESLNPPNPPFSKGGNSNLWRWNGSGGLRQGLVQSLITFGALKGAGRLAQGQNFIAQHLFQDSAMVLGHQATGALGLTDRPRGSLAEQFLHAETTNLQLGAGMALAHGFAPGLQALERGLDLTLRSQGLGLSRPANPFAPLGFKLASQGSGAPPLESRVRENLLLMSVRKDPDLSPSGETDNAKGSATNAFLGYKALFDACQEPDFRDFPKILKALRHLEEEGAPIDFNILVQSVWTVLGVSPAELQNSTLYLGYQKSLEALLSKGQLKGFAVMPVYNAIMGSSHPRELHALIEKMNQTPIAHTLLKIEVYKRVASSENLKSPRMMGTILKDLNALGRVLENAKFPALDLSSVYMNLVNNKNFSGKKNIQEVVRALPLMLLPGAGALIPCEILKSLLGVRGFRLKPYWQEIRDLIQSLPESSQRLNFWGDLISDERLSPAEVYFIGQEIAANEPWKIPDPDSTEYEGFIRHADFYAGALGELGRNPHSRNFPLLLHKIRSLPVSSLVKAGALVRMSTNPYFNEREDFISILEEIMRIQNNKDAVEAFTALFLRNPRLPKEMVDEVWGQLAVHHPLSLPKMVIYYRSRGAVN